MLLKTGPSWAIWQRKPFSRTTIEASPFQASGTATAPYTLEIFERANEVNVRESAGGRLPGFCPERHINDDGTLCIGFEAGKGVDSAAKAERWWRQLEVHLLCQDTASRTRIWPSYAALSHGDAGETQLIAEALAEKRGMIDAVKAAMFNEGPIHAAQRLISRDGTRLINRRAPCFCGAKSKTGNPVLRLVCNAGPDEGCLVRLEHRRRHQEEEFWKMQRGMVCCGSMEACPLVQRDRRHSRARM